MSQMIVPFHKPFINDDEITAVTECMRDGWLTMGKRTFEFETLFKEKVNAKHAAAVNSCTAALHLALCCAEIKEGDEVIIPTTTFVATAETVKYFKAVPVLAEIDKDTHLIDVADLESKITPKTKAIIPVHYAGQACDMDEILSIAQKHNIYVIEDAAHSFPASYKGRAIGSIGDATCFSFYATKTITTGEGGMITTHREDWCERIRRLRLHGISSDAWKRYSKEGSWRYDVTETGYKYNTTDISAAIGIEQLKKAGLMLEYRRKIASIYDDAFNAHDAVIPYKIKSDRESAYHLYPLRLNIEALKISRDQFIEKLNALGIITSVHFIPLYEFTAYKSSINNAELFPASKWVFERVLSLPIYAGMSDDEIGYVVESVLDVLKLS